ncbi:MAG: hypothetical protein WDA20_11495 [Desulfuromonadales bacterium]
MLRIFLLSIVFCTLALGACSPEKPTDSSDHLLSEQKKALDKAKDVDRLAREAAERQRRDLEENR